MYNIHNCNYLFSSPVDLKRGGGGGGEGGREGGREGESEGGRGGGGERRRAAQKQRQGSKELGTLLKRTIFRAAHERWGPPPGV